MRLGTRIFGGERPKLDPRNLDSTEAQVALDCEMVPGTVRSLRAPRLELEGIPEDTQTIFLFKERWFTFDDALSVAELNDRVFFTDGAQGPRQATFAQLLAGESYAMGVPKPFPAPGPVVVSGSGNQGAVAFETFYVVTFVNTFGEEGDKSDPSETFLVETGQTATLNGLGVANQSDPGTINDSAVTAQRIYRLSEGESKFVAEIPISDTSFTEVIGGVTLGEVFSTEDYFPPPAGMVGLHLMANEIGLGFVPGTRIIYVSEIGNLNAWPHFFEIEDLPVAISSYDNNAVIVTESYPVVAAIVDPANVVPTTLTYREPCEAPRSLVQAEGGVQYASTNGVFYIGRGGGVRLTRDHLDFRDWQKYSPSTILALYKDRQYIGFHQGLKEGNAMVFDQRQGDGVLRQMSQRARAVFVRPGTDQAFVAIGGQILELEGSEDRLVYRWRGKQHGGGSHFAQIARRVLSCEQIDRGFDPDAEENLPALYAARAAELSARSGLDLSQGIGGAINQFLIGGCGDWILPGTSITADLGATINGGGETDLPRIEVLEVTFRVYGDKELVHEEVIEDDLEDDLRLTYFDRRRLYELEIEGNLEISQMETAGSNSELFDGA